DIGETTILYHQPALSLESYEVCAVHGDSPPGATVTVRFSTDRIEVENPGTGVPPDQVDRLGDRFFRGAGQSQPGSGLGLSIVQRIASRHGLSVGLSNKVGNNSVQGFVVTLRPANVAG